MCLVSLSGLILGGCNAEPLSQLDIQESPTLSLRGTLQTTNVQTVSAVKPTGVSIQLRGSERSLSIPAETITTPAIAKPAGQMPQPLRAITAEKPNTIKIAESSVGTGDRLPIDLPPQKPKVIKAVKPLGYLLDLNEASEAKLRRVPGLTDEIYSLILNTRPFLDMVEFDDELSLMDISSKDRQALYTHLFMVIDINNSPAADLQFVPQLKNSLAHQILSGRPYKHIDELKSVIEDSRQSEDSATLISYFKISKPES